MNQPVNENNIKKMFGLFKKNKTLPTFAPLKTDMHCHLLPLVDDGSKSLEESLESMVAMKEVGFDEIKLTPHFQYPRFPNVESDILERYKNFLEEIERNRGDRDLPKINGISGEYRIDDGFGEHIKRDEILTFHFSDPSKGSKKGFLLMELSLHQPVMGFEEVMFERQMEGYDVILAHPERYPYFDSHSSRLEQMKEQGVYFQSNILSLDGFYGEEARKKAFDFIENGWIEFLGTDMHNTMYSQALRHASTNRKIIQLIEKEEFQNKYLVEDK